MSDLAVFLRDFHADKTGPVDLDMLDFLADVMAETGQPSATVLSGYRTRETNERLRATTFQSKPTAEVMISGLRSSV